MAQKVKNPPAAQETWVWSLGQEDPLEKGMATHSSVLAWRIIWTEEPGGLQSMEWQSQTRLSNEACRHNYLKKVTGQNWGEKKKSWVSFCLFASVVYILKQKSEGLERQLLTLDQERMRKMKSFQEERVKTKKDKAAMSQSKGNVRSIVPASEDGVVI